MRIGIVINSAQNRKRDFHYSVSTIRGLSEGKTDDEYIVFTQSNNPIIHYIPREWNVFPVDNTLFTLDSDRTPYLGNDRVDLTQSGINLRAQHFFKQHHIDMLLFPSPHPLSFECGMPYIMAIHDLQHRMEPHFPEVSAGMNWTTREYLYRNAVRYAQGIITSSEICKGDILKFYGQIINSDNIYTLPIIPPYICDATKISDERKMFLREKHLLPERYFFYPAKFWQHKNHPRLIHALHILRYTHRTDINLILVGSRSGSAEEACELVYRNSMFLAQQLGVPDLVYYLGYAIEEEMPLLYATAYGLIMPSLLYSTNYPVIEAWNFECPVIASDIKGIKEIVGNAGVLINPSDPYSIAEGLLSLWNNETLCKELVQKGQQNLYKFNFLSFTDRLHEIIIDICQNHTNNKS